MDNVLECVRLAVQILRGKLEHLCRQNEQKSFERIEANVNATNMVMVKSVSIAFSSVKIIVLFRANGLC